MKARSRGKRILAWVGAVLGVGLVLGFGALTLFVFQSLRPYRWPLKVNPGDFGIAYQDIRFAARDGVSLAGWWVPTASGSKGTVILCHGYPANRSDVNPLIPFLHRAGYDVMAFDFRRLGESGGSVSTIGLLETRDLLGAVDEAARRSKKPIGALGMSMGAAVSLMAAAREPRIRAVVADSPYISLDVQAARRFGPGFLGTTAGAYGCWLGARLVGHSLSDASPLKDISAISPRPVFLIHGAADRLIPPADSEALFAAAGQPKDFWLAPGSRHVHAFADHTEEYERRVLAFFAKSLKP